MISQRQRRPRAADLLLAVALAGAVAGGTGVPTAAHSPDPALGSEEFAQDARLEFDWRTGAVPPAAMRTAIKAAADDIGDTRASRAATFVYDTAGTNPIGYGTGTCGVNGLACFTRDAPDGFTMWFREQGRVFDWGTLKWCQMYTNPPNGCYDVETVALDEFGHVEGLGHHANFADESDYTDAVVQTFSRTKPREGWNMHVLGVCDVARLQIRYDIPGASSLYSTCLDIATVMTLSKSAVVRAVRRDRDLHRPAQGRQRRRLRPVERQSRFATGRAVAAPITRDHDLEQRRDDESHDADGLVCRCPCGSTARPSSARCSRRRPTRDCAADGSPATLVTVGSCTTPPCPLSIEP